MLETEKADQTGAVVPLTTENFKANVFNKETLVVVDFWAEWCGPCNAFSPIIEQFAEQNADRVFVSKVNVDENKKLAAEFDIRSIPTLLVFKSGQVVERISGAVPANTLNSRIEKHLS